ncbi:hypothetical protein H6G20_06115 [Desertifilum sp. FACHB-1129]|uniref:hypothetical protein n=1 Tax=unclassified Desertifilum TaxID=2621682 RepID=UPI0013C7D89A|nr:MULTISPECIES: hypothetical protein [unclassified Desertifilum]MDA0213183.1 hypothetical protein [Cyanobacteria bacterium FC1]NES98628.1 hypothetical protein [Desertifilum sp. SIO1I2]MBD2311232.1 hypothetical protein [Desertifilum sp. FACHB-1129]MBD2324323.1 hypothetical protein [Desertifilum sp. FACHB-866]MBD2334337.1 hypothetical protein [Desertifilum sp. FACHB-868]
MATQRNSRTVNLYANAIDQVADAKDRTKWMLLSVLKQRTGLKLSDQFKLKGIEFDWTEFKQQFDLDYSHLTSKELFELLRVKFGFKSLDEVRAAFKKQSQIRRDRQRRYSEELDDYLGTDSDDDEFDD